ncbi:LOW QUALITY PROTEIN: Hypothetical protein PHPALM_16584 [Phytophthora palmivora]|uniref:Reverse transcriptase Ty1/copia-type domain-containing protein n=1 Tax=Phytophthora palmivora TaxID=4796 RepID=A0A2P4XPF5_9STRA|nr:LOW QUALITY PROTEIN: Hypothetical protein PHPALM_16584 [Phytophthora palmivora]
MGIQEETDRRGRTPTVQSASPCGNEQEFGVDYLLTFAAVMELPSGKVCLTDACVYVKTDEDGITVVGTYVDDLLVTATSNARVDAFIADMAEVE